MLTYKAYAKINWALSVLRKRDDGYHDIVSLMHAIDLYDTMISEPCSDIKIEINFPIKKEDNLVYKAIKALQNYTGVKKGVKIIIEKRIPIGAGLGGGSSDAATAIKALNELWQLNLSIDKLHEIGASIGSDIPFFFYLPMSIAQGRGEIIKPLKIQKSYMILLVKPAFSISTKLVYEFLERKTQLTTEHENVNNNIWQLYNYLYTGQIKKISLWNDLEETVIKQYPEIGKIKKKLIDTGAEQTLLSGSGSAVFGVFQSEVEVKKAAKEFKRYWHTVTRTLVDLNEKL